MTAAKRYLSYLVQANIDGQGAEDGELLMKMRNFHGRGPRELEANYFRTTYVNSKGIGDAGSTADLRMLWSAIVCLGLL